MSVVPTSCCNSCAVCLLFLFFEGRSSFSFSLLISSPLWHFSLCEGFSWSDNDSSTVLIELSLKTNFPLSDLWFLESWPWADVPLLSPSSTSVSGCWDVPSRGLWAVVARERRDLSTPGRSISHDDISMSRGNGLTSGDDVFEMAGSLPFWHSTPALDFFATVSPSITFGFGLIFFALLLKTLLDPWSVFSRALLCSIALPSAGEDLSSVDVTRLWLPFSLVLFSFFLSCSWTPENSSSRLSLEDVSIFLLSSVNCFCSSLKSTKKSLSSSMDEIFCSSVPGFKLSGICFCEGFFSNFFSWSCKSSFFNFTFPSSPLSNSLLFAISSTTACCSTSRTISPRPFFTEVTSSSWTSIPGLSSLISGFLPVSGDLCDFPGVL